MNPTIQVRGLQPEHGFYGYVLPSPEYPVPVPARNDYLTRLADLLAALDVLYQLPRREVLFQVWKLHHEHASKEVSKYGKAWMPAVGVGVWPHKPPPAIWTVEEFKTFVPDVMPRPPIYMVMRLKGTPAGLENVLGLMGGRGVLIEIGIQGDPEMFYRDCDDYFRGYITEPIQLAYPFFVPLLDGGALEATAPEIADRILGGVHYYVRESPEDKGILILSRRPLDPVFRELQWELTR